MNSENVYKDFIVLMKKSCVRYLVEKVELSVDSKNRIYNIAKQVIEKIKHNKLSIVDSFMQQYSLSNDEGIAFDVPC